MSPTDDCLIKWPYVAKPISRDALLSANTGPGTTSEQRGIQVKDGKPVVDWELTATNVAKKAGKFSLPSYLSI